MQIVHGQDLTANVGDGVRRGAGRPVVRDAFLAIETPGAVAVLGRAEEAGDGV